MLTRQCYPSLTSVQKTEDCEIFALVRSDMQWAYLSGIRDFVQSKSAYLQSQVGNPDGPVSRGFSKGNRLNAHPVHSV